MKIGIISDTHGRQNNVCRGVDIFRQCAVEYVLHAGDIVDFESVRKFSGLEGGGFIAVYGNCDADRESLSEAIRSFGGEIYKSPHAMELGGKNIFLTHIPQVLDEIAGNGIYDLIIYGHTHKLDIRKVNESLILNPGTAGVIVLELDSMTYEYFKF